MYETTQAADGTTRPTGTPIAIMSCVSLESATQRTAQNVPVIGREGIDPIASDSVPEYETLELLTCARNNGERIPISAQTEVGRVWFWLPTRLLRAPDDKLYVTFGNALFGSFLMFRVFPDALDDFKFTLGSVYYAGRHSWMTLDGEQQRGAVVVGMPAVAEYGVVDCVYFAR